MLTGLAFHVVDPSPNWPLLLFPQQCLLAP